MAKKSRKAKKAKKSAKQTKILHDTRAAKRIARCIGHMRDDVYVVDEDDEENI